MPPGSSLHLSPLNRLLLFSSRSQNIMKRLIKRYVLKAQVDRESDEVNEGKKLAMLIHPAIGGQVGPAWRSVCVCPCVRLRYRWAEGDQAGHFQPPLRAPGGEVSGRRRAGSAHPATRRQVWQEHHETLTALAWWRRWRSWGRGKTSGGGGGQNAGKWVQKGVWNREVAPPEKRATFRHEVSYAKCHFLSLSFFRLFFKEVQNKNSNVLHFKSLRLKGQRWGKLNWSRLTAEF